MEDLKIKNGMIWSYEIDKWVTVEDYYEWYYSDEYK